MVARGRSPAAGAAAPEPAAAPAGSDANGPGSTGSAGDTGAKTSMAAEGAAPAPRQPQGTPAAPAAAAAPPEQQQPAAAATTAAAGPAGSDAPDVGAPGGAMEPAPAQTLGENDAAAPGAAAAVPPAPAEPAPKTEEDIMAEAEQIRGVRALLCQAYGPPAPEPDATTCHQDYMMQEMRWLAVDMAQERLWKRAAAARIAAEAAQRGGAAMLRPAAADGKPGERTNGKQQDDKAAAAATADGTDIAQAAANGDSAQQSDNSTATVVLTWTVAAEDLREELDARLCGIREDIAIEHEKSYREYLADLAAAKQSLMQPPAAEGGEEGEPGSGGLLGSSLGRDSLYDHGDEDEDRAGAALKKRRPKKSIALDEVGVRGVGTRRKGSMAALEEDGLSLPSTREKKKRKRGLEEDEEDDFMVGGRRGSADGMGGRKASVDSLNAMPGKSSKKNKQNKLPLSKVDANSAAYAAAAAARGGRPGQPPTAALAAPWTREEDLLLCAIVHEFGSNWLLISDVISSSNAVQGVYRRPDVCRYRFKSLASPTQEPQEVTDESVLQHMNVTKGFAREILSKSLPVPEVQLRRTLDAVHSVGQGMLVRKSQEERQRAEGRRVRQEVHASHHTLESRALQQNGGRYLMPGDIINALDRVQEQQQQAGVSALQGMPSGGLPPGALPPTAAAAAAAPPQQQPPGGAAPPPAVPPAAAIPGAAGLGSGQLPTMSQPPTQNSLAAQLAAGAGGQFASPGGGGVSGGGSLPPGGLGLPSGGAMDPQLAGAATPRQGMSMQQLQTILQTGTLPNGTRLTPEQRQHLVTQLHARRQAAARAQGQVAMQGAAAAAAAAAGQQQQQRLSPGMQPGMTMPLVSLAPGIGQAMPGMAPGMASHPMYLARPGVPGTRPMAMPASGQMPGASMPSPTVLPGQLQQQQVLSAGEQQQQVPGMAMMQPGAARSPSMGAQPPQMVQQMAMQQQQGAISRPGVAMQAPAAQQGLQVLPSQPAAAQQPSTGGAPPQPLPQQQPPPQTQGSMPAPPPAAEL